MPISGKTRNFRIVFSARKRELLRGPPIRQAILDEINRLADQIDPEVARNQVFVHCSYASWVSAVEALRTFVINNKWAKHNVDFLCKELHLSQEVRDRYFSEIG